MRLTWRQRALSRTFLFLSGIIKRMTLGVRTMVLDGNKVLLVRHTYYPGWHFPGGGVDPGETIEAAARREILEETGFAVNGPLELFGLYHHTFASDRDHVSFFIARSARRLHEFKPSREIAEIGWFDLDKLPEPLGRGTGNRIAEFLGRAERSDDW